jgi:16S rRNA processing protein RimM
MTEPELVVLGTISKPQGLRGAFRVRPTSLQSNNLATLKTLFLGSVDQNPTPHKVKKVQDRGGFFVVQIQGVDHIDQVTGMIGTEVSARLDDLAELDDGEFYWFELVGLKVVTTRGRELGKIESIIPTGANDVLVVNKGRREKLIPYIDQVVVEVNLEEGVMTVDLPPGLLD